MTSPIMTARFEPAREDAAVYVRRAWTGPVVVLGHTPAHVIRVDVPDKATVPLGDNLGPVSREAGATTLRNAAPFPIDVYVLEVQSPSGERRYGMLGVPRRTEPAFGSW